MALIQIIAGLCLVFIAFYVPQPSQGVAVVQAFIGITLVLLGRFDAGRDSR